MTHQVEIWNRTKATWELLIRVYDEADGKRVIARELKKFAFLSTYGYTVPELQHFRVSRVTA